ncbi:MAG: tetratricopeptide repeat protein [Planctomycetaceae bacterium]|nr:tetratricopeptide repeat protein [Planctomycetaceae bacterium]
MHALNSRSLCAIVLIAVTLGGCAPLRIFESEIPDIHPLRQERSADVVASFEKHRADAEFNAARAFWKQGQKDDALRSLEALTRRVPEHVGAQQMLMECLLVEGHLERAAVVADSTASLDDARIWHARGLVYEAVNRPDEAWKCLETAVKIEPRNVNYLASLKAHDELHNQSADMIVADDAPARPQAAAKRRGSTAAMAPACVLLTAETCLAMGRCEEARERLEMLAAQGPHAQHAQDLLRRIAQQTKQVAPVAAAVAPMNTPRRLPSTDAAPIATHIATSGKPGEVTIKRTSVEVEAPLSVGNSQTYLHQAGQALAEGHPDTAAVFLRKARELAPHDQSVALSTSVLPLRHEEYELAASLSEEALRDFPQSAGLYRILGTAQYRLCRWAAARDALQHAITLDNRDGLSYFLMGCTLNKLGQPQEAEPYLRQAQTLDRRLAPGATLR